MKTKFTREEEEAIVKLWMDNEQEMRCLAYFEKNHPIAVEWARDNVKDMLLFLNRSWVGDCILCNRDAAYTLRPGFKLPEPEKWFYSINRNSLHRCREGRADKQDSIFGIHCIEDFDSDNYVEVPTEYLEYVKGCIERHNKGEFDLKEYELRRLVGGEECERIDTFYESVPCIVRSSAGELRFVKKPTFSNLVEKGMFGQPCESCPVMIKHGRCNNQDCRLSAKPEWKEVFNNGKIRVEERVK